MAKDKCQCGHDLSAHIDEMYECEARSCGCGSFVDEDYDPTPWETNSEGVSAGEVAERQDRVQRELKR